ncbi:cAMP-responsive element-binding protein-like 2, partial [Sigmodon hispidus]
MASGKRTVRRLPGRARKTPGRAGLSAEMDDSMVVGGKVKKPGKRGQKPAKIDLKAKLESSRQSARVCRARKKLRYPVLGGV